MKLPVRFLGLQQIFRSNALLQVLIQLMQPFQHLAVDPVKSQTHGVAVQMRNQRIALAKFIQINGGHPGAPARQNLYQTFFRQQLQRFVHRGAADVKIPGKLILVKPLSWFQRPIGQPPAETLEHPFLGGSGQRRQRILGDRHRFITPLF